jgi:hypothetical protein
MYEEIVMPVLTKFFNKTQEEIEGELLVDGKLIPTAQDVIFGWDANRVSGWKKKQTDAHDEGYKKAEKKIATEKENKLKELVGITTDKTGDDLFAEITTHLDVLKAGSKTKGGATEEEIKRNPLYIQLEQRLQKEYVPLTKYTELQTEFTGYKNSQQKNLLKEETTKIFMGLNPIFATSDNNKISNSISNFNDHIINSIDAVETVEGKSFPIKEGKRLTNQAGYAITLDEYVKQEASKFYEFKAQSAKGNAGNTLPDEEKKKLGVTFEPKFYKGPIPKTIEERNQFQSEAKTPDEKYEIGKLFIAYENSLKKK